MNLTVYEKWWSDPRRTLLIQVLGDPYFADGVALNFWKLAQTYLNGIPEDLFTRIKGNEGILKVGLAVLSAGRVYVKGSNNQKKLSSKRRASGRLGGLKSAELSKPKQTQASACRKEIERLYEGYPKKVGKSQGIERLVKELREEDLKDLEKAIQHYSSYCQGTSQKYIKQFSTFTTSWRDWIEPPPSPDTSVDDWMEKAIKELKLNESKSNGNV